ncbi:unnamed protein product [Clavelina lepadiformis]|uniref:Uncharacterized protein n=1 Tax=Clavelina lepadiformis TaxID=159417 RepID=A0ABP0GZ13_CLALP
MTSCQAGSFLVKKKFGYNWRARQDPAVNIKRLLNSMALNVTLPQPRYKSNKDFQDFLSKFLTLTAPALRQIKILRSTSSSKVSIRILSGKFKEKMPPSTT